MDIVIEDNLTYMQRTRDYWNEGYRYAYIEIDLMTFGAALSMCQMYHVWYTGGNFNVQIPELAKKRKNVWQAIGCFQEVVHQTELTLDERKAVRLLPSAWRTEDLKRYYPDLVNNLQLDRTLKRIVWSLNAYYYTGEILIHPTFDRELSDPEWSAMTDSNVGEWLEQQKELFLSGAWGSQDFEFTFFNEEFHVHNLNGESIKTFWFPDYVPPSEFEKFKGLPFKTVPK